MKDNLRCGAAIDENIGRLLKTFGGEGLKDNTIVVYVSDQDNFWESKDLWTNGLFKKSHYACPVLFAIPKQFLLANFKNRYLNQERVSGRNCVKHS